MSMESFIVRVYRRGSTNPGEIAGIIETVGTDEKKTFHSYAALITALKQAVLQGETQAANPVELASYTVPGKIQTC